MYIADRVRETTTTTGSGTVTLAGAVAQYQTFTSRVKTGDPCEYVILDANGTAWEVGVGTMATTSTLSRDTILQSSNSDAAISLSAGTHTVFLTFAADRANKATTFGDMFIDYVVSGLQIPTTSGSLAGTLSAGVAYVVGQRVVKGAQAHTYTASRDTYVDLNNVGLLTYAEVSNGAAAPSLTANSIRLGKVVTGGSTITSGVNNALDSLGNWMRNPIRSPTCILFKDDDAQSCAPGSVAVTFGTASFEQMNNAGMHSITTNNSRVTMQTAGLYQVSGGVQWDGATMAVGGGTGGGESYIQIFINGTEQRDAEAFVKTTQQAYIGGSIARQIYLAANDYVELKVSQFLNSGGNATIYAAGLSVSRIG